MPWVFKGGAKGAGKGGKGKGWTGGGGGGNRVPQGLPEGYICDPSIVYIGTVSAYYKFQGYGFVTPDQLGVIPGDKVFVLWKNLVSTDRYPHLNKDMKVQFTLQVVEKKGVQTLQAANVMGLGGVPINLQDEADQKKVFVGGQNVRYPGSIKFFLPKQGYGYIKIDPGYQYDKEGVPEEIRVEMAEMNCGGGNPTYMEDIRVEFGIWQTTRGAFKGYNVTLPGGQPLPQAVPGETPPGPPPPAPVA